MRKVLNFIFSKALAHQAWTGIGVLIAVITLIVTIYPINTEIDKPESEKNSNIKSGKAPVFTSQRIALIIGNTYKDINSPHGSITRDLRVQTSSYSSVNSLNKNTIVRSLANPVHDAKLITKTLKKNNFKVITGYNKNKYELTELIKKFQTILSMGGTGLFYFSGHAININGHDYILPSIKKIIQNERDFIQEAVNLTELLQPVQRLIDKHPKKTGSAIFYAATKGGIAFDGIDGNSPFTKALVTSLKESKPTSGLFDLSMNIEKKVVKETKGLQRPWFSSSTSSDFYFKNRKHDKNIDLMKLLFIDTCRNNPFESNR